MAGRGLDKVIRYLSRTAAVQHIGNLADTELLERFVRARDSAAFEVLVWRHGTLVLNVCQRVTRCEQDAEDGFQATFVTLARKAHSIGKHASVASWLYKVAFRAALELKRRKPRYAAEVEFAAPCSSGPLEDALGRELQRALDEEVILLPARYRTPILLSCFQGKTNQEIAEQLGCPEATVRTRLARGRERLRARLSSRGLPVTVSSLGIALTASTGRPASAALVSSSLDLAFSWGSAGKGSSSVFFLAERMQRIMFLQTVKQSAAVAVVVLGLGCLTAFSVRQVLAEKRGPAEQQQIVNKAEESKIPALDDRKAIIGTWEATTTMTAFTPPVNGEPPVSKEMQIKTRWVITADKVLTVVDQEGFLEEEFEYHLDSNKQPKTIDLVSRRVGPLAGIYHLNGAVLKIALGRKEHRPTEFADGSLTFRRVSAEPVKVPERYPCSPGCYWMIQPSSPAKAMATLGITYLFDEDKEGNATVTAAYSLRESSGGPNHEYRPVLFDSKGQRYLPRSETMFASATIVGPAVRLQRWCMDSKILPANKIAKIGIEAVTAESTRLVAKEAADQARHMGIDFLPWPELGADYPLNLTTIDGRKLGRGDFKGKVLLVDCWASWCAPCMAKLPELKRLHEKWHKDGLEIVGVNLDSDVKLVRAICKKQGLDWPEVMAPVEEKARTIWHEAAGIESIPRIFLIDRDGKLRAANSPADLDGEIAKLLKK